MTPGVKIAAYNLGVGAVFATSESSDDLHCVTQVLYRHTGSERIGLVVREVLADRNEKDVAPVPNYDAPSFDFEDEVWLVGMIVNPDTWDDDDFGQ